VTLPGVTDQETVVAPYLGAQVAALRQRVAEANTPANLDGLLARHILGDQGELVWNVDPPDDWLQATAHRGYDAPVLAVLAYAATNDAAVVTADARARLVTGLQRMMERTPFPMDRLTFLHDIRILIGIAMACRTVIVDLPDASAWLKGVTADPRRAPADRFGDLIQRHTHAMLAMEPFDLPDPRTLIVADEMAMAHWALTYGTGQLTNPAADAFVLRQRALHGGLTANPSELTVARSALLLHTLTSIIASSVDSLALGRSQVSAVLRRFPAAMHRWVWDGDKIQDPVRWIIRSEREVQSILWIMLRGVFDDVVDEEWLPKFGHTAYRADFGLPRLGLLIEVKYAYQATDFKQIQQQVMIDSIGYLKSTDRYREIIIFIYDESGSSEHHDTTRRALLGLDGIADVIIVPRPGRVPARDATRPRPRTRKISQSGTASDGP
jgi:hypothetical protein